MLAFISHLPQHGVDLGQFSVLSLLVAGRAQRGSLSQHEVVS
jgi:hypothetical protein